MLFIIVCFLFSSSRFLLNVSCIFSIMFLRFCTTFSIITLNSFSGSLPISSSLIWSCMFLLCSFVCNIYFCSFFFFFLMHGAIFLSYQLFGLRHTALEFTGSWIELGLDAKMRTSRRLQSNEYSLVSEVVCQSNGLDSELSPQELGSDLWPQNQDPASYMVRQKQNKTKQNKSSSTIIKNNKQNKIRKIKNILGKINIIETTAIR